MTGPGNGTGKSPSVAVRGGLAVVLSVLANVVLLLGVNAVGIAPGFQPLTVPPVAFLSGLGAAGAAGVYWALRRYRSDPDRTFVRLATGVLVLSFVPDVALLVADPAATPLGVVVLMLMHLVVGTVSVGLLVYWKPGQ